MGAQSSIAQSMDGLGDDLLLAIVERVCTRTHAGASQAFLQAQLRRNKVSLDIRAPRLPWFLWSGDGVAPPQLHIRLFDGSIVPRRGALSPRRHVSLPANLVASRCVVRELSASAGRVQNLPRIAESMPGISILHLKQVWRDCNDCNDCIQRLEGLLDLTLGLHSLDDAADGASIGAVLAGKTRLRRLALDETPGPSLLSCVGRMTWLERLDVRLTEPSSLPGLALLAPISCIRLDMVCYHGFVDIARSLGELVGLACLTIRIGDRTSNLANAIRVMGASMAKLEHLTELAALFCFADPVDTTTNVAGMFTELRHLRKLRLADWNDWDVAVDGAGDGDRSRFCHMVWDSMAPVLVGLTELHLDHLKLDASMVRTIPMGGMAAHLAVLSVSGCTCADTGLLVLAKEVAALTALRVLDASYAGVSDEIAAELACSLHQMKNVAHVNLARNHITDSMGRLLRLTLPPSIQLSLI